MEVRRYPHLYNPTLKSHKDSQQAYNSWHEIADNLNSTPQICKEAWHKLRDKFTKTRNRIKKKTSGDAGGEKSLND